MTVFGVIFLPAVAPHDVLEDVAKVARLVERGEDGVDGARPDRVPALDQLHELVDDGPGLADLALLALERQPVAAQEDGTAEAVAKRPEDLVVDGGELGRDLVRDVENFLHRLSVGRSPGASAAPRIRPPRHRLLPNLLGPTPEPPTGSSLLRTFARVCHAVVTRVRTVRAGFTPAAAVHGRPADASL